MTISRVEGSRGRFGKGRPKTGGRRKGTPNRATRAVKAFLAEMLERADVQDAIRDRILRGDTSAFFKAVEIVYGKPRRATEVSHNAEVVLRWARPLSR